MATPKRKRNPLPDDTSFHVAAQRYIKQGGSERGLVAVMDFLGKDVTIAQIDGATIDRAAQILGSGLTDSTVQSSIIKPIKTVLNHAFDTGRKRGEGRRPPRWLTPDEAEQLIAVASDPQRIGLRDPHLCTLQKIAFMLGVGAAPGETITIDATAHNKEVGTWSLPGIPSMIQPRVVLPPDRASDLMRDIPTRGPAFLAPNGQPYVVRQKGGGQMAEAFNQIRTAAGLEKDVTPATCRTTWAVWFHAQVQDLDALIECGGWAGPRSAKPLAKLAETGLSQWLMEKGWDFRGCAQIVDRR